MGYYSSVFRAIIDYMAEYYTIVSIVTKKVHLARGPSYKKGGCVIKRATLSSSILASRSQVLTDMSGRQ